MTSTHCPEHTGQDERIKGVNGKLNIVMWMLALLITVIVTGTGVLYSSIQTMNTTLAAMSGRFASIEAEITILESNTQQLKDRVDAIDTRVK